MKLPLLCENHFPFGLLLLGRHRQSGNYRFGYLGQEKYGEVKGEGNSVNYKYRMHDARIGRFFAVAPLTHKYQWNAQNAYFQTSGHFKEIKLKESEEGDILTFSCSNGDSHFATVVGVEIDDAGKKVYSIVQGNLSGGEAVEVQSKSWSQDDLEAMIENTKKEGSPHLKLKRWNFSYMDKKNGSKEKKKK